MHKSEELQKVDILIDQSRYKEAASITLDLLTGAPNNPELLAKLGQIRMFMGMHSDALEHITKAISLEPEEAYYFALRSGVYLRELDLKKARTDISEAIRLDPYNATYFGIASFYECELKNYTKALELADRGLELDPREATCLNSRSTSLTKLGRHDESFATIEDALAEDPNNAQTHTNYGWNLLEAGKKEKALEHFKQAVQLEPTHEYAKAGMAEALKSKYWAYRLYLKYQFFLNKLPERAQWGVIIGAYILFRLLNKVLKANPELGPVLYPLLALYSIFALSSWLLGPLGDCYLAFNKYGHVLLDERERLVGKIIGAELAITGLSLIGFVASGFTPLFLLIAGVSFTMIIPTGKAGKTRKKGILFYAPFIMGVFGLSAISFAAVNGVLDNQYTIVYFISLFLYFWVANFAIARE
ncbi:MAG: tetratricopeptide repeat protein [Flavobacteriia bacterium]|nr:tetratricopeptide repeat protein [Flavobacteriia bacterium]